MEEQTYKVKTDAFEGPFGLLLDLVEKRKLFINDVSLASVTEDFLAHMNKLGNLTPREVTSFVQVAATLILIKSKSLLPNLNLTDEEQGDIKSLEERLRLYKLYIKLGGNIKSNFGKSIIFAPLERKNSLLVFLPDNQITKESMMGFAEGVLGSMPKKVILPEVEVRKVISIEEMIDRLIDRVKTSLKMSFKKDFGGSKVEVIVGFLAMLELVRNGLINAEQNFDDITITKQETETL